MRDLKRILLKDEYFKDKEVNKSKENFSKALHFAPTSISDTLRDEAMSFMEENGLFAV